MGKQITLKKDYKIENGVVIINETIEKQLTKEELLREVQSYDQQQGQIVSQMNELKLRYKNIENAKQEVLLIINEFPVEDITI